MTASFWASHLASEPPSAQQHQSLGDQYAAYQAAKSANGSSGSFVYSPEYRAAITGQRAAVRPSIYVQAQQPTLEERMNAPRPSKYTQKPGESDYAFTARLRGIGLEHLAESLPEPELEAVAAQYNGAVQRIEQGEGPKSGEQLHAQLAARQTGVDRGVIDGAPQDRAALVHMGPTSMAAINQVRWAREQELRAQPGQHQDTSQLRSTGAASGWIGADR